MPSRPFVPAERMADRFERAYTLNFTTIASVRGALSAARIVRALRCLERRHPLLRARIDRSDETPAFVLGEGKEVPLFIQSAPQEQLLALAARSVEPCQWDDAGPHAELTWVQHDAERSSLMLRQHHVVSDGGSGIIAMRDLLAFLADSSLEHVAPLPSPGQDAFFPPDFPEFRRAFLEELSRAGPAAEKDVLCVSTWDECSPAQRRSVCRRMRLSAGDSAAIARRARQDGATVHGVLMGALALAIAKETDKRALQRLAHPVDLRRFLRELDPTSEPIPDAMGYYVSALTTEHELGPNDSLGELAGAITQAVRAAKAAREPLWTAPIRGPLLVERTRALDPNAFRELAEQKVFRNTFGVSNLGPLERLGVAARVGELDVDDFFFVAASSVMNQLGGTAASFAGRIAVQLNCVEPMVRGELLAALADRVEAALEDYARGAPRA